MSRSLRSTPSSRMRATARSSSSSLSLGRRALASSTVKSLEKEGSTPGVSFSAAHGQAVGEHAGEAGGPDLGLRLLYVVLDEAVGHMAILGEDVGGEGVSVAGLAYRAGVHQVGAVRAQVEGVGFSHGPVRRGGHGLDVRVPEKADRDPRVLALQ